VPRISGQNIRMNIQSTSSAVTRWQEALAAWAIPVEILEQAPENPWVHPPALFKVESDAVLSMTPSVRVAIEALQACESGKGSVLDVGCGGGGSAMPLAEFASEFLAVDEQAAMLTNFVEAAAQRSVPCRTFEGRWLDTAEAVPSADVVVCHHVLYNVSDIEPFIRALTSHARRRVVVEVPDTHPTSPFNPLWQHFWNLERPLHPTGQDLLEVLAELGIDASVERFRRPTRKARLDAPEYIAFVRRRLCLPADRDPEIAEVLANRNLNNDEVLTLSWPGAAARSHAGTLDSTYASNV
jgi:SAM-dependent methyltransferase